MKNDFIQKHLVFLYFFLFSFFICYSSYLKEYSIKIKTDSLFKNIEGISSLHLNNFDLKQLSFSIDSNLIVKKILINNLESNISVVDTNLCIAHPFKKDNNYAIKIFYSSKNLWIHEELEQNKIAIIDSSKLNNLFPVIKYDSSLLLNVIFKFQHDSLINDKYFIYLTNSLKRNNNLFYLNKTTTTSFPPSFLAISNNINYYSYEDILEQNNNLSFLLKNLNLFFEKENISIDIKKNNFISVDFPLFLKKDFLLFFPKKKLSNSINNFNDFYLFTKKITNSILNNFFNQTINTPLKNILSSYYSLKFEKFLFGRQSQLLNINKQADEILQSSNFNNNKSNQNKKVLSLFTASTFFSNYEISPLILKFLISDKKNLTFNNLKLFLNENLDSSPKDTLISFFNNYLADSSFFKTQTESYLTLFNEIKTYNEIKALKNTSLSNKYSILNEKIKDPIFFKYKSEILSQLMIDTLETEKLIINSGLNFKDPWLTNLILNTYFPPPKNIINSFDSIFKSNPKYLSETILLETCYKYPEKCPTYIKLYHDYNPSLIEFNELVIFIKNCIIILHENDNLKKINSLKELLNLSSHKNDLLAQKSIQFLIDHNLANYELIKRLVKGIHSINYNYSFFCKEMVEKMKKNTFYTKVFPFILEINLTLLKTLQLTFLFLKVFI